MKNRLYHTLTRAVLMGVVASTAAVPAYAASSLSKPGQDIETTRPEAQADVENKTKQPKVSGEAKFMVKNIQLDAEELELDKNDLKEILIGYVGKEASLNDLEGLQRKLTSYCRSHGYPAAAAYLPEQESKDGNVLLKIIPGRYGEVHLDNKGKMKNETAESFLHGLKQGEIITSKSLETALYSISDVSGARAVGTLSAGKGFGTSDVTVHIEPGKPSTTVLYVENYGSENTGRYRYGLQYTAYDIDGSGAKANVGVLISNQSLHNYYANYEMLVGHGGTTLGIGYSRMDYTVGGSLRALGSHGTADTISVFGSSPIYHTSNEQLKFTYGYDYRKLKDDLDAFAGLADSEKHSHSVHVGLEGSWLNRDSGTNLNYSLTLTGGTLGADSEYAERLTELSGTDGSYAKAEAKLTMVQTLGHQADVMVKLSGQKASKHLDSSEQMYLGGANAVRAYGQGAGTGDDGVLGTVEFRLYTDVPGLVVSTYFDIGHVSSSAYSDTLKGWGIGLAYNAPGDWFARIDYARRIGLGDYESLLTDRARLWFLVGKIW